MFAQDAGAADTGANDQLTKPINLDVRSANLYYALTLLFDQLKIGNFTLPEALKSQEVSARFTQLPLRTALETLLKNSGYTYKVDAGVYSVVPKEVDAPPAPLDTTADTTDKAEKKAKVYKIKSYELIYNAATIVEALGGKLLHVGEPEGSQGGQGGGFGGGGLGGGQSGFGGGLGGGGFGGGLGGFGGGGQGGFGGGIGGIGGGGFGGGGFGGGGFGGGQGGGGFGGGGFGGGGRGGRGGGGFGGGF